MRLSSVIARVAQQDDLNFLLTNRIPRRLATRLVRRISQSEHPIVRGAAMRLWTIFSGGPDLDDAATREFASLDACFTRKLKAGARPLDPRPAVLVSPCDGIIGASGRIDDDTLLQAKGHTYTLGDLVGDVHLVDRLRHGSYVTLRLTSTMYHRFHAPADGRVEQVTYVSGDTWNVNPSALRRIPLLYCKNERAIVPITCTQSDHLVVLVPVAAILVASICFTFVDVPLDERYRGPTRIACNASFRKGDELGYFRHGSTVVVLAPHGMQLAEQVREGRTIRMGEPLLTCGGLDGP
jgi:phosphatidylserine decarboxylase